MLSEVELSSFALYTEKNMPFIIMRECSGDRTFTIPVTTMEANSIALHSLNVSSGKPGFVEIINRLIEIQGGIVEKIILQLSGDSVDARIVIIVNSKQAIVLNSDAADAIVLALHCNAPMFAEDAMLTHFTTGTVAEQDGLKTHIAETDTLEFGSFYW